MSKKEEPKLLYEKHYLRVAYASFGVMTAIFIASAVTGAWLGSLYTLLIACGVCLGINSAIYYRKNK